MSVLNATGPTRRPDFHRSRRRTHPPQHGRFWLPAVIASRLGHTSVKTVLDVYGHLYEGLDRNAADTLNPPWDRSDVDALWSRRTRNRDEGRGLS